MVNFEHSLAVPLVVERLRRNKRGIFPFAFLRELADEMARAEAPQA